MLSEPSKILSSKKLPGAAHGSPILTIVPVISTFFAGAGGAGSSSMVPPRLNAHTASPSSVVTPPRPPPDATTTYCTPSTEYVIGGALTPQPVWNDHRSSPVRASWATRLPSTLPRKTSPPAVLTAP